MINSTRQSIPCGLTFTRQRMIAAERRHVVASGVSLWFFAPNAPQPRQGRYVQRTRHTGQLPAVSPLRGCVWYLQLVQGLPPLAISFRPSRG